MTMKLLMQSTLWVLLVLVGVSWGQEAGAQADMNPTAESEVRSLESDMGRLLIKGEFEKYAALLTEDFVRTTRNGTVQSKREFMEEVRTPEKRVLDVIPEEVQVRVYGESAIVSGHASVLSREHGRVSTVFSRYTEVFVKRQGHWLLAAQQETAVRK